MIGRHCLKEIVSRKRDLQYNLFGSIAFPKPLSKTLTFNNAKASSSSPATGEVKVATKASQVTSEDIRAIKGISFANPLTSTVGTTSIGTIESVGSEVINMKSGDHVFVSYPGTWTDSITVPVGNICKIPTLSPEEAALIPSIASAWAILTSYVPLKAGDTVISLNGANPIGMALVEVGKALGITVINATPSDYNAAEFKAKLKGEIKLCVTSAVGSAATNMMKNLSPNGVQVFYNGAIISTMSGEGLSISATATIFEGKSLCGFDFSSWAARNPKNYRQGVEYAASLIANKKFALKAKVFKMAEYAAAMKMVEDTGALVVLKD